MRFASYQTLPLALSLGLFALVPTVRSIANGGPSTCDRSLTQVQHYPNDDPPSEYLFMFQPGCTKPAYVRRGLNTKSNDWCNNIFHSCDKDGNVVEVYKYLPETAKCDLNNRCTQKREVYTCVVDHSGKTCKWMSNPEWEMARCCTKSGVESYYGRGIQANE